MLIRTLLNSLLTGLLMGTLPAQSGLADRAELQLPWVFADHMVLQQDRPTPVWGQAPPNAQIQVQLGNVRVLAQASATGKWRADLPAQEATRIGRELTVASGTRQIRFEDVVVGEVWLCAGQSNMDFPLSRSVGGAKAATELASTGLLRLCNRSGSPDGGARRLTPAELANITPQTYYRGTWHLASEGSAAEFSAVGAFFGQRLGQALDVPIGLIDVSVGGSTTEGWIPLERLAAEGAFAPLTQDYLATPLSHPFIRERVATQFGAWVDAGRPNPRPRHFFEPGFLFDSAIAELAPFCLRGALWYQGESNAHLPRLADRLFRAMVEEWRRAWSDPALTMLFVQLPALGRPTWPEFREVQAGWLDIPHTGMAVALDAGHPTDVHPRNKRPVGERLAGVALAEIYGLGGAANGPRPVAVRRHDRKLVVQFQHAEGLAWAAGRDPTGFEVSGQDRRFYPAQATLSGTSVALTSPEVEEPVDARYAWAPVPVWSLVNGAGLPAAPFRTQRWRPIRVACIGDSITAGLGLENPGRESYPARLQERLGDGFHVQNFGRSGTCVVLSAFKGPWARAFRRNPEHENALSFEPHIVISNLGINDIMAWPETGAAFPGDYGMLIEEYRALDTHPAVLVWGPLAPLFEGQPYFGSPYEREIHQAIAQTAQANEVLTIDLHAPLRNHPDWFPDQIHPDARGADAIAATVHEALVENRLAPQGSRVMRLYVLTGQSNSLGTTADPSDADPTPGVHPADAQVRFFWSNLSSQPDVLRATRLGNSGGEFTTLKEQQGGGRNATFWGPEFGLGRTLYESGERDFAIVKASRGGGGNGLWSKGSNDDHMYRHVVHTVESAIAALPQGTHAEVAALFYLQGESDNAEEARLAGERLEALGQNLRRDLPHATAMHIFVGGIAAPGSNRDLVREEQAGKATSSTNLTYVSNLDLASQLYDSLHFNRPAKLEVGRRFAAALLAWKVQRLEARER